MNLPIDNRQPPEPASEASATSATQADPTRRRFTVAGIAGAGVLMSLSSRSALGSGFGQCGSESVSAAMSRHGEEALCGCSPGFWWRSPHGLIKWGDPGIIPVIYGPDRSFNQVFGRDLFAVSHDRKLRELGPGADKIVPAQLTETYKKVGSCSNLEAVLFHAIAALLNASFYGSRYPSPYNTPAAVISAFQQALDLDASDTNTKCGNLNSFKSAVDVYDLDGGLWCFNGQANSSGDWEPKI